MHRCKRPSGHSQHQEGDGFDFCTERCEKVVLLYNLEYTKGKNIRYQLHDVGEHTVRLSRKTFNTNNGGYEV